MGFTLVFVVQAGRLAAEGALLAASLAASGTRGVRMVAAEPQPGPLWPEPPGIDETTRTFLGACGVEVVPFESREFGAAYPNGNKIEALLALPAEEPFLFLDTDTLVLSRLDALPFDFARPAASLRREDTWPRPLPGGPSRRAVWAAVWRHCGLDLSGAEDPSRGEEDWERYPYHNAGWFFGPCPRRFGTRFRDFACRIRDDTPPELAGQALFPWLDQIVLPSVLHAEGGGGRVPVHEHLDGPATLHYRALPLLYAREAEETVARLEALARAPGLKALLRRHRPFQKLLYQGQGRAARALFPEGTAGMTEQAVRKALKAAGFWWR